VENESINVHFGTILGFTGDLKGHLIFHGDRNVFSKIGEVMFGMPISGEMLVSFTGELGNMLAGSLSTFIFEKGCTIDITPPSVLEGDSKISVFNQGVRFIGTVQEAGVICISILLRK
jgi:chemotaxis protein CheX